MLSLAQYSLFVHMQLLCHNAIAIQQSHQTALSEQAVVDLFILNIKLHPEQKDKSS